MDLKADLESALHRPVLRVSEQPAIAVVPFQNFSTEAKDFFAEGLMQELAAAFASAPGLRIVSKRARNATAVLEGSVRTSDGRVRVVAQLMNPGADQHVWTERFDRDLRDVFAAQEEIAKLIVAGVRKKLAAVSPLYLEGLGAVEAVYPGFC